MKILIIGIDANADTSHCAAWYARQLQAHGLTVATLKFTAAEGGDLSAIDREAAELDATHDVVLIEGPDGLMTPIAGDFFAIDYAASRAMPIALATSSDPGAISPALLSLQALRSRRLALEAVLCSTRPADGGADIQAATLAFIRRHVASAFPGTPVLAVGK